MAAEVKARSRVKPKTDPQPQPVPLRDRLGPPPDANGAQEPPGPLDAEIVAFEPVRLTSADERKDKRITLFYIGDTGYDIPAVPGMEVGLNANRILSRLRLRGVPEREVESGVMDYILETMLGEEGYEALLGFHGLKAEDFEKIAAIAYRLTLGALEVPKAASEG